jgi:hypothetical protein
MADTNDAEVELPSDPTKAFAYLVSRCASGLCVELIEGGLTDTQARNQIIHHFLAFAAGEACRIARSEEREPNPEKWAAATRRAFDQAVKRTAKAALNDSANT